MSRQAAGWVAVLALGGCQCGTPRGAAPDAGPVVTPGALRCEQLLPEDVADSVLPGARVSAEQACATCGPRCTLESPQAQDATVSFAFDCSERYVGADVQALLASTLARGAEPVPALGKGAARRTPVPGMVQVVTWDDDTPCLLVVTWVGAGNDRTGEAARLALRALTPDQLRRPAPSP